MAILELGTLDLPYGYTGHKSTVGRLCQIRISKDGETIATTPLVDTMQAALNMVVTLLAMSKASTDILIANGLA